MASFNDDLPLQTTELIEGYPNGDLIKIKDLHDYSGNTTEGIVYTDVVSRVFTLYDSNGDLITTIDKTVVNNEDYSVDVIFTKDKYFLSVLTIVTSDENEYVNETKFGLTAHAHYKRILLIERNRVSNQQKLKDIISDSLDFITAAEKGLEYGNAAYLFDERIDDANKLLDSVSYC